MRYHSLGATLFYASHDVQSPRNPRSMPQGPPTCPHRRLAIATILDRRWAMSPSSIRSLFALTSLMMVGLATVSGASCRFSSHPDLRKPSMLHAPCMALKGAYTHPGGKSQSRRASRHSPTLVSNDSGCPATYGDCHPTSLGAHYRWWEALCR